MIFESDELARDSGNSIDITRKKCALFTHSHDHRAAELGSDDSIRIFPIDHDEGICTNQSGKHSFKCREKIAIEERFEEFRDDFGIRLTIEFVSFYHEFSLEFMMVLDDPIVDDKKSHIARIMWMRIRLCDTSVRCPTSMSNTRDIALLRTGILLNLASEIGDLSNSFLEKYFSIQRECDDSGGIIASIFEISESLDEKRNRIFLTIVGEYSAHIFEELRE